MGGAIGVAYGFCFMRAPKLLPVLVALHVVAALVLQDSGDAGIRVRTGSYDVATGTGPELDSRPVSEGPRRSAKLHPNPRSQVHSSRKRAIY
jgi:hypothetical protein